MRPSGMIDSAWASAGRSAATTHLALFFQDILFPSPLISKGACDHALQVTVLHLSRGPGYTHEGRADIFE